MNIRFFEGSSTIESKKEVPTHEEIDKFIENIEINPDSLVNKSIGEKGNVISAKKVLDDFIIDQVKNKFNIDISDERNNELWISVYDYSYLEIDYQEKLDQKLNDQKQKTDLEKLIIIESINDLAYGTMEGSEFDAWTNTLEVADKLKDKFIKKDTTILEKSILKKNIYDLYELDAANRNFDYDGGESQAETWRLEKDLGPYEGIYEYNIKDLNKIKFDFTEEQKKLIIRDKGPFGYFSFTPETLKPEIKQYDKTFKKSYYKGDYINSWLAPGIVGVYGINGRLIGCKKIEDISKDGNSNTIDDVFDIRSTNNSNVDVKDLALFKIASSLFFRDYIKKITGVDMSTLSISNQFYFLDFIQNKTEAEIRKVADFIKASTSDATKTNKIKSFLSVEHGGREMGIKIIELGEKLPKEISEKVFTKYGEIIDNIDKVVEFTQHNFAKEIKTSPELIQKIEETLYIKGKQILGHVYEEVSKNEAIDIVEIEKQLDRINADTITTLAIFKQALKNGEKIPIESIQGAIFSKKEATEFTGNQQKEMTELYDQNWKNHPDRAFVESLKTYFNTAFNPEQNKQKNYFYTFEKDEKIRAFVRFEKQENDNLYASALNVDEATKNFGLGEAMMDEALVREAEVHILHASCRKDNPSNMRYFEKGFISRGFKKTDNTEELDLLWDETKNKNILAKQKTVDELVTMYLSKKYEGTIEIKKAMTLGELHEQIPGGKALVRCFMDPLKGGWYAVYETIDNDYGVNTAEAA